MRSACCSLGVVGRASLLKDIRGDPRCRAADIAPFFLTNVPVLVHRNRAAATLQGRTSGAI